ncbi:MAG: hypothetical protein RLZZ08_1332 [Pseudomonadota bacterium]|jgi:hypothetical protein
MKHMLTTTRTASTAIAAVLALNFTPAFAQDVAPPPAPVIVLPDVAAPDANVPSVSTPVVQAVPVDAAPEPAATVAPAPAAASAQPRRAAAPAARAVAEPEPVAETAPLAAAPVAVPPAATVEDLAPVAPAAMAEPAPLPAPVVTQEPSLAGPLLGGLAVAGLGVLGAVALRRRKRDVIDPGEIAIVEKPRVVDQQPPVPTAQSVPAAPRAAEFVRHDGRVALPRTAPANYQERSALLQRMVEARPDRANPFASRKARTKRARLILQSLGHDFADRDPLIDLGDYPQNWPLVARRRYAAAA